MLNVHGQIYKDVTLFFSQDAVSTIGHVIPTMDRIGALVDDVTSDPLSLSVKYVLKFTRNSINKYYSKMDQSNVYRIAMGKSSSRLIQCFNWNYIT